MKALLLVEPGVLEYTDVPEPTIEAPTDAIVRVAAAGICGSDTHGYTVVGGRRVPPLIMGHEFCGTVVELGADARHLALGDRVFMMNKEVCGQCEACVAGAESLCQAGRVYGADLPGAFAERVRVSSRNAVALPASVSSEQGALVEPLSVVLHGLSRVNVQPGDSVAVVGAGVIGLLAVAVLALHNPRHLIVIEPNMARRGVAIRVGATGVCTLVYKNGKLVMPEGERENWILQPQNSLFAELLKAFSPDNDDVITIASAPSHELAEHSAMAAALTLLK